MKKDETNEVKIEIKQGDNKPEDKKGVRVEDPKPEEFHLQLMRKGDYLVHVLIEEVRNLFQKDPNIPVFPTVKISCFNKTLRTPKLKNGATNYIYSEHFYFEKPNLSIEELDSEKIVIEVYDSSFTDKKDYLGIYECDFAYVYNHKNFSIHNRWVALANPEAEDITKVRGYLKLSICILHEKDDRVELKYKSTDNVDSICIIPPHVKIEFIQLFIYMFKAEQLPDMDYVVTANKVKRKCNAYVTLKYMGIEISTDVKDMDGDTIVWNQVICLPVTMPVVSNRLVFSVWDKDLMRSEIVGTFEISLLDILSGHHKDFKYVQIYGAPVGRLGVMSDKMNSNSEIGSLWKGRILLKIDHEKTDNPNTKCVNIPKEKEYLLKDAGKLARPNQWIFNVNLFEAVFLPKEDGLYTIKIAIQDTEKTFCQPIVANKRTIKFDIKTTMQLQTLSDNLKDIGDVFIYLVEKDVNICFQRISAETFFNNDDILIIKFFPDPSIGKMKDSAHSGLVKLKIQIVNKAINVPISMTNALPAGDPKDKRISTFAPNIKLAEPEDEEEEDLVAEQKRKKEAMNKKQVKSEKSYMIVANIYMTRYLLAGDSKGTSDLYAVLKLNDKEVTTKTKYDTLNCIWNESRVFENVEMDIDNKSTWPIIFLQVMDKDKFNYADDLIAYNYTWLSDSHHHINNLDEITPKWHQLFLPISNSPQGQILLSFFIIDMKLNLLTPIASSLRIAPDSILYSAEVNVLGLRDLKPLAFLPIKKAFITFDLNSANLSGKDDSSIKSIKTAPKNSGANPTINTVIKFDIRLPKDNIYMPELQCSVYDYLLAGMLNQMLGIFLIPLKDIIKENKKNIEMDMKITEKKIGLYLLGDSIKYESQTKSIVSEEDGLYGSYDVKANNYNSGYTPLLEDKKNVEINLKIEKDKKNSNINADPFNSAKHIIDQKDPIFFNDPKNFVIYPIYKKYAIPGTEKMKNCKLFDKEDDYQIPDPLYFEPVGYNKYSTDGKKHYRRIFSKPLEKITELDLKSPFYTFPLKRGKYVDKSEETGIFEALKLKDNKILKRFKNRGGEDVINHNSINLEEANLRSDSIFEEKEFGKFKGLIRVVEKSRLKEYENMIETIKNKGDANFLKEFKYLTRFNDLSKKILTEKKVYVRLYVLKLGDLAKKDILSESDPYLKIILGDQIIDESKNFKEDSKSTDWCKSYDLGAVLPGDPILKIQVWDYDPLFSDELIGFTKIDLEDRFYNDKWTEIKDKPIEKRILKHPDFKDGQGWITLWLEIFENRIEGKKWDVSSPPKVDLELRLIVWETENIPIGDVEGVSDQYVLCYVDNDNKQSTDIHYRCQEKGSYNWRIVLPLTAPRENTILNVLAMDKDLFSPDDYLSGNSLQLASLIKDVYELDIPVKFSRLFWNALPAANRGTSEIQFKDQDKFWLKLYKQGPNGVENGGRVLLSMEMLPKWKAQICKVGMGRENPNVNPYLPPPIGRFEWSLNPFKMINQCVGAEYRQKIYCLCCCSLVILYFIGVIPYILLHLAGEVVNPYNYKKK